MASSAAYSSPKLASTPAYPADLPICDPHFHVWDTAATPNANLGGIVDAPHPVLGAQAPPLGRYTGDAFARDVGALPLAACLHVETVVGQTGSPGDVVLDTVAETRFVAAEARRALTPRGVKFGVVAFVQLARDDAEEVLRRHAEEGLAAGGFKPSLLRGVRMILNYSATEPSQCWPQVGHGRFLTGEMEGFNRAVAALGAKGLVLDLHVNWHQLHQAAGFLAAHAPATTLVLDHLGCLKLGSGSAEEDAARTAEWRRGLAAVAANPRAHIKISGLEYIAPGWMRDGSPQRAIAQELVAHALALFGAERCMVASNFPVDLFMGQCSLPDLYACLHEVLVRAGADAAQLRALFHDNAVRVYGVSEVA